MARKLKPEPKFKVTRKKPPRWQREHNLSRIIWVIIPTVIAIVIALVGFWSYDTYVAAWDQVVASVNDTKLNMDYYVKMLRFYSQNPNMTVDTTTYPYQVLQVMEDNEIISQFAPELDIQVTPDEITQTIESQFATAVGNSTAGNDTVVTQPDVNADEMYHEWLKQIKLTDGEYRHLIEADLMRQDINQYLDDNEVPTEADQVHLNLIVVSDEVTASEVETKLKEGGNFTELATEYCTIDELKAAGGDVGWVPRGIYTDLDDTAFSLPVGNVSDPISGSSGYYILKVINKAENMAVPQEYRDVLLNNAFENWIQKNRDASTVEEYLNQNDIDWAMGKIT